MELVLNNNLCELTMEEMLLADGGFDLGQFASGVFNAAAGVLEGAAGLAGMAAPEPLTTALGVVAVVDGYDRFSGGVNAIINSFK